MFFESGVKNMIDCMIDLNPECRPSADEILTKWEHIFPNHIRNFLHPYLHMLCEDTFSEKMNGVGCNVSEGRIGRLFDDSSMIVNRLRDGCDCISVNVIMFNLMKQKYVCIG